MAAQQQTGRRVQTWLSPRLAREVKELADRDRRSVSSLIRVTLEDRLETASPPAGEARRSGDVPPSPGAGNLP